MKTYPVYFIDADQTLFDFRAAEAQAIANTLTTFGLEATDERVRTYHQINDALWKALERGEVDQPTLRVRRFEQFLQKLHSCENPKKMAACYAEELANGHQLFPKAVEICEKLSAHAALYLTTNGIAEIQRKRFAATPLPPYFQKICISEEVGYSKPDARYFETILKNEGLRKEEVLVVGDSLTSDIKGANAAGLDCCWYNPAKNKVAEGVFPTYIIDDLAQLAP